MIKEFCGVFGIWDNSEASYLTYLGLYALQHRGQESAGIVSYDGKHTYSHKDMGLVSDVFSKIDFENLKGNSAVGHVRYSTTGSSVLKNAQPLLVKYKEGFLAIGHNGNLVNSYELRKALENEGAIFQTTTDSEVILHLIAHAKTGDWMQDIIDAFRKIKGAFSVVMMNEHGILGARDPNGFRPLCIGKLNGSYILSSETCALDLVHAEFVRDVEPGEIVLINDDGIKTFSIKENERNSFCIFEHIYFARPDSVLFGELVHEVRKRLGMRLAEEHPVEADMVMPVPDSGLSAAIGYSQGSGIALEWGFIRNHYVGRTFIQPVQKHRDLGVRVKLNIMRDVVKGRRLVVVDDSIVRGTTSQKRVRQLREAGAKEVHLRISCPPHKWPCFYGIDFPSKEELIANRLSHKEIEEYLGVDSLGHLSIDGMLSCLKDGEKYCHACFSGRYPIEVKNGLKKLALES